MTTLARPTSIEQVRERLSLLKMFLARYDELTEEMVKSRWSYEILKREPKLGINPRDPRQTTSAAAKVQEIEHMEIERSHSRSLLLAMTDTDTVDLARERYMLLHSSFQRYAQLLELFQLLIIDVPAAYGEVYKVTGRFEGELYPADSEVRKQEMQQVVQDLLDAALEELKETAYLPLPDLTEFVAEDFDELPSLSVIEEAE